MQNFDPQVAARVWQRVFSTNEKTCEEKPACPLEGIQTVPGVWEENNPKSRSRKNIKRRVCHTGTHNCPLPVLVYALVRLLW